MSDLRYDLEARVHDALAGRDSRIEELLKSNNEYLERARKAEARVKELEYAALFSIKLTPNEIQSNFDRVKYADGLIRQLPETHDGRNTWLLNYGRKDR